MTPLRAVRFGTISEGCIPASGNQRAVLPAAFAIFHRFLAAAASLAFCSGLMVRFILPAEYGLGAAGFFGNGDRLERKSTGSPTGEYFPPSFLNLGFLP